MRVQCPDNIPAGIRVNSNGVTIHVFPGKPRTVAPHLVRAAGAEGCYVLPDEGDGDEPLSTEAYDPPAEPKGSDDDDDNGIEVPLGGEYEPTARHEQIVASIQTLMTSGDATAFTPGSGRPRKGAVRDLCGFDPTVDEITAAFEEIKAAE